MIQSGWSTHVKIRFPFQFFEDFSLSQLPQGIQTVQSAHPRCTDLNTPITSISLSGSPNEWTWSSYRTSPRRTIVWWFMGWLSMISGDIEWTWKIMEGYLGYLCESLMAITIRECCGRYRNTSTLGPKHSGHLGRKRQPKHARWNDSSLAPFQAPAKEVRSGVRYCWWFRNPANQLDM